MSGLMYAEMGMSIVSAFGSYSAQKFDADMAALNRKYRETMSGISAAMQLNTLTENEISAREAAVSASIQLQQQSLKDRGAARVSAGAAGVAGGSVTNTMRGLMRSKMMAQKALRDRVAQQRRAETQQRRNVALARAMDTEVSVLPQASLTSSLLGLGAEIINIYDAHQPEGQRTTDTLARLGQ